MFLRDTDWPTLADVADQVSQRTQTWSGSSTAISVRLVDDAGDPLDAPIVALGEADRRRELPMTETAIAAIANSFEIPLKFLQRVPVDEQQFILDHRIQRAEDKPLVVKHTEAGISEIFSATVTRIEPERVVERLLESLFPPEAPVTDWWSRPDEFRLDVIVPQDYDRGIGGDRAVGDLTHGGVRIGQNRKQNLAPWVQPFLMRLACTNGMEIPDVGLRVEARGATADLVVAMLVAEARRAFDRVEDDIRHFYDLRNVPADEDFTGHFRRMLRDTDLPERTIGRMEDTLSDAVEDPERVTMWDLVNHVTNQANDPLIRSSANARRALERAGGQMVSDHAARCTLCHSRL